MERSSGHPSFLFYVGTANADVHSPDLIPGDACCARSDDGLCVADPLQQRRPRVPGAHGVEVGNADRGDDVEAEEA